MKDNLELERNDIAIDSDMEVDGDIGQEITVYIARYPRPHQRGRGYLAEYVRQVQSL